MNVEQAYVKSENIDKVTEIIDERLNGLLEDMDLSDTIDIPDSYNAILRNDKKRKIAISSPNNGWITVVESKEVNDYSLLIQISERLQTEVFALVQSDVIGAWGFVECVSGIVKSSYYSEEDECFEDLISNKLKEKKIYAPLYMFRDVVKNRDNYWRIVKVK